MSHIALFHSVLGVRRGVIDAGLRLTAAGHDVTIVDQYDGEVFDDYEAASEYAEGIGYTALMEGAVQAVAHLPDGFVAIGFSNGGGMAEYLSSQRELSGVVMVSGAIGLDELGVDTWPAGLPAQVHYSVDDPFRNEQWIDGVLAAIRESGSPVEMFDYSGAGHLFSDRSLTDEYHEANAELLMTRLADFCAAV